MVENKYTKCLILLLLGESILMHVYCHDRNATVIDFKPIILMVGEIQRGI